MSSLFSKHSVEIGRLSSLEPPVIVREALVREDVRERLSAARHVSGQREDVLNLVKSVIAAQLRRSVEDLQLFVVEEFRVQPMGSAATLLSELVLESRSDELTGSEVTQARSLAHSLLLQLRFQANPAEVASTAIESAPGIGFDSYIQRKLESELRPDIDVVDEHLSRLVGRKVVHPMRVHVEGHHAVDLLGHFVRVEEEAKSSEPTKLRGLVTGVSMVAGKREFLRLSMECVDGASSAPKPHKVLVEYKMKMHEPVVWALLLRHLGRETTLLVDVVSKRAATGKWTKTYSLVDVIDATLRQAA